MQDEHMLVEGYYTTCVIPTLCQKANVDAPVINEIYKMVYEGKNVKKSIEDLMNREIENIK